MQITNVQISKICKYPNSKISNVQISKITQDKVSKISGLHFSYLACATMISTKKIAMAVVCKTEIFRFLQTNIFYRLISFTNQYFKMFVLTNNEKKNAAEVLHLQLSQLVELLNLAMILLNPVKLFFLHFHPAPRYNVKTVTNDHITQLNPTLIGFTSTLSGGFGLTSVWIL